MLRENRIVITQDGRYYVGRWQERRCGVWVMSGYAVGLSPAEAEAKLRVKHARELAEVTTVVHRYEGAHR